MSSALPRRLAAIWFADIAGYTDRSSRDEDEALELVRVFQMSSRQAADRFGGRVVKFTGDGVLAEFQSVEAAVRAACSLCVTFGRRAEAAALADAHLHVGVHVGEVATDPDGDIYGKGVNVAERVGSLAEPGQILVSEDVWRQLAQRTEFRFEPRGEHDLKGIDEPVELYAVALERAEELAPGRVAGTATNVWGRWRAFLIELGRRHVLRIGILYLVMAMAVTAVVVAMAPEMAVPVLIPRTVVAIVILGFPIALVLSWMYEITAGGLRRARPSASSSLRREWAELLTFSTILALLGVGLTFRYLPVEGGERTEATSPIGNRVAVLYFDDFSEDRSLGFLVNGLTEALIQELGAVSGLEVVSRNGVKPYEGVNVPVDSIARALKAGTLVQGSVAESGDLLRVTVQLIDGPTGTLVESETLERSRGELFALQDQLSAQVAEFLRHRMGEEVRLREMRAGSSNVEAWELVQRAEQIREEAGPLREAGELDLTGAQFDRADSLLALAESLDPEWIEPTVQRGWLAYERVRWRQDIEGWIEVGLGHAESALTRSADDPDALELRGSLIHAKFVLAPDPDPARNAQLAELAEQDLRRANNLDPTRPLALSKLAHLLGGRGALLEAKLAARQAYEADAYLAEAEEILWRLTGTTFDLNQAEELDHWCQEGRRRYPENPDFVECQIWLLTIPDADPTAAEAWRLFETWQTLPPQPGEWKQKWIEMFVSIALARAGLADSAAAVARRARGTDEIDPGRDLKNLEAFLHTVLGDYDQAVELLGEYLEASPQKEEVAATWWFEDLRNHPGFRAIVATDDP